MYRPLTIVLFILITSGPGLKAQEHWDLNRCIHYALENNLTHHLYALDEKTARIDATQSKLNILPAVSASSSAGVSYGRSVDPNSNDVTNTDFFNTSGSLGSSIGLFQGFIRLNRIAYTKFRFQAAQWKKINYQDDLAFDVLTAYFNVLYYQGLVEIAGEQLKLSENNVKKTETQIETGLKARTDLAEMQAAREKEMLTLIRTENTLEEVKLQLGQLMNLTAEQLSSFIIENEGEQPAAMLSQTLAADSLFTSFVQFSPYVKMAQAELNAASKNVAMARGQYFPSVNLGADVNTVYSETNKGEGGKKTIPFRDQIDNNLGEYVGASLSIPIFGRNEVRNEVRKAKLAREQAETQLEQYRQTIYYELMNNSRELYALSREYGQTMKQLEANELAYKVAERKYDEGLIDVIELLTVKNRVGESKGQLLNARLQWHIKSRIIEFYKGIRFWEGEGDRRPETGDGKTTTGDRRRETGRRETKKGDCMQEPERQMVAQGSGSEPQNVVE